MKFSRYAAINTLTAIICVLLSARLVNLQITNGAEYRKKSESRTTRFIELTAPRGEILDRYGRSIVKNRTGYNVYIQKNRERGSDEVNRTIANLFEAVRSYGNDVSAMLPKGDSLSKLCKKYEIDTESYTEDERRRIAAVRSDMVKRGFSVSSPYLFAEDVPIEEISVIKEQNKKFGDVTVITQPVREYPYGSLGAHMLGRVGNISEDEYKSLKNDGYTINSSIGKDGIEKYMEDFLRGKDGRGTLEQTAGGYSIGQSMERKPSDGRSVTLTIDLDLQKACESALSETIAQIGSASAGSAVVIDVNSGDVLAMASYPSYDIKSFNREYSELVKNKSKPLFNRALSGTYTPGSVFKMLVAAAGLETGAITVDERILDTGKYKYFKDYQPACWIYNQSGGTHGYENVSEAIRDSCNVFFYETGRRLTIDNIDKYAKSFGFGQKSGIELSEEEKSGVVASPENRKKKGEVWYPGDTCQTAIGQSDTLVTPLQLANYIASLANGGTRYKPHLIKSVRNTDGTLTNESRSETLEMVKLKKENYEAIVSGMRMVVTEGTAHAAFSGCSTSVAAKTGSAQTGSGTNGVCVAYAPYDKPRIAIACVIENAGSGAKTAAAVRKITDSYFGGAENEEQSGINSLLR